MKKNNLPSAEEQAEEQNPLKEIDEFLRMINLERRMEDEFNKVMEYCNSMKTLQGQIVFLQNILEESKTPIGSIFYERISKEIYNRKLMLRSEAGENPTNQKTLQEVEKIDWQGNNRQLIYLFEQLSEEGFFNHKQSGEIFSLTAKHFLINGQPITNEQDIANRRNQKQDKSDKPSRTERIKKINWQGNRRQLMFLFEQLSFKKFLINKQGAEMFSLIAKHFLVNGKPVTNKQLIANRSIQKQDKRNKPKNSERIEQIVSAAYKIKE